MLLWLCKTKYIHCVQQGALQCCTINCLLSPVAFKACRLFSTVRYSSNDIVVVMMAHKFQPLVDWSWPKMTLKHKLAYVHAYPSTDVLGNREETIVKAFHLSFRCSFVALGHLWQAPISAGYLKHTVERRIARLCVSCDYHMTVEVLVCCMWLLWVAFSTFMRDDCVPICFMWFVLGTVSVHSCHLTGGLSHSCYPSFVYWWLVISYLVWIRCMWKGAASAT